MGKLEKIGRSILKKFGTKRRRAASSSVRDVVSSDEEMNHQKVLNEEAEKKAESLPDIVDRIRIAPMGDEDEDEGDEMSAGYATDDTALSSLSPLDVKRRSSGEFGEGSESQGYYSTAELSPREAPIVAINNEPMQQRFQKNPKQYPRINVSSRDHPIQHQKSVSLCKSTNDLNSLNIDSKYKDQQKLKPVELMDRSLTLSNLISTSEIEDPIDRFMRSAVYKTKMITTVFEATNGGIEEIYEDVIHEIDRWFESKNMMAVACEMHWSTPRDKRNRQAECRIKEKLLNALRENNRRLLYLRGMGRGKTPIKLAESKTVENITRDKETDSVRGIYQRSYTKLLPYLHRETPEWHSQYWSLTDFTEINNDDDDDANKLSGLALPDPQHFLFGAEPAEILAKTSLVSLNIIGLSILGNSRKSCTSSMFFED